MGLEEVPGGSLIHQAQVDVTSIGMVSVVEGECWFKRPTFFGGECAVTTNTCDIDVLEGPWAL